MKLVFLILILLIQTLSYSNIAKISVYPSQIRVSFQTLKQKEIEKKITISLPKKTKRKSKKNIPEISDTDLLEIETLTPSSEKQEYVKFTKFIRVINGINLNNSPDQVALSFFDENDIVLETHIIQNTPKPSPNQVFFIDKNGGKNFQGKLDIYYIPKNASYFMVGIINSQHDFIQIAKHANFSEDGKIFVSDYEKIAPNHKIMLQIELLKNGNNIVTRACGFRFN